MGAGRLRVLLAGLVALVMTWALAGPGVGATASASASASASDLADLADPFSREVVRPGDQDVDPYHVEHVFELQYRLRWLGYFDAAPTGYYGSVTEQAVKELQASLGLPESGVVGAKTWRPLIRRTVRGRAAVPPVCKSDGWHACYDRWRHQVNLYHSGELLNSWLVRGGASDTPTRKGKFTVYYRDIDHVSQLYDAPMPYAQFFSGGQALHGSRLMMDPFVGHSHGCVNFWVEDARQLWRLTSTKKLHVRVYGAWD